MGHPALLIRDEGLRAPMRRTRAAVRPRPCTP